MASLALIVPVLLDAVINAIAALNHRPDESSNIATKDIQTTYESIIIQVGFMLPVIMPFLPDAATTHSYFPTVLNCVFRGNVAIVMGIFFASKTRCDATFSPSWATMLFYLSSIAGNALYHTHGSLAIASVACRCLGVAIFLLALIRWLVLCLWRLYRDAGGLVTPATAGEGATVTAKAIIDASREKGYTWYRIAYATCTLLWMGFKIGVDVKASAASLWTFSEDQLYLFNVPSIVFQLFFLVLSMRVVRFEAVTALVSLLEAKKQYVRYIR
jgi:hypothetical protein